MGKTWQLLFGVLLCGILIVTFWLAEAAWEWLAAGNPLWLKSSTLLPLDRKVTYLGHSGRFVRMSILFFIQSFSVFIFQQCLKIVFFVTGNFNNWEQPGDHHPGINRFRKNHSGATVHPGPLCREGRLLQHYRHTAATYCCHEHSQACLSGARLASWQRVWISGWWIEWDLCLWACYC